MTDAQHQHEHVVTPVTGEKLSNGLDSKHMVTNGNSLESLTDSSTFDVTSTDSEQSGTELDMSNTVTSVTSDSENQSQGLSGVTPMVSGNGSGELLEEESSSSDLSKNNMESSKSDQDGGNLAAGCALPNLTSPDWYMNPCFQRYWKYYYQSMAWCQKHREAVKSLGTNQQSQPPSFKWSSTFPYNPYPFRGCPYDLFARPGARGKYWGRGRGRGIGRGRGRGKMFQSPGKVKVTSDLESSTCSQDVSDSDSEVYEMEITEEMLEFFAKSEQHRKERDARKEEDDEEKHVVLEGSKANKKAPTTQAPKEQPGVRRTAEMNQLYGKGAAMIHGMETALQMTFDRNMDILQPKFWPNMPLKITFS